MRRGTPLARPLERLRVVDNRTGDQATRRRRPISVRQGPLGDGLADDEARIADRLRSGIALFEAEWNFERGVSFAPFTTPML